MISQSELYTQADWAELFVLCTRAAESTDESDFQAVTTWLTEYSVVHSLPEPEETDRWSDTRYTIKEALSFLAKFAENHDDDFLNRKRVAEEEQQEQQRRDEKNGLYPDKWDGSN